MRDEQTAGDDAGFGMVEIVVGLFILGVLAISFLPLLWQGLRLSADNATRATAVQIMHDRLEEVRVQSVVCETMRTALNGSYVSTTVDPRGISFQVTTTIPACPTATTAYPGTSKITVSVRRTDDLTGAPISSASTLVFVKSRT